MKWIKMAMFVIFSMFLSSFVLAEDLQLPAGTVELKIAAGSSSKIYEQIRKEIQQICPDVILTPIESSGAVENLDKLIGNEAGLAFMHSDVLAFRTKQEKEGLPDIQILLALFSEDVNIITLNRPYQISNGTLGFGKKAVEINTFTDLEGLPIGAAGGGFITASVMRLESEVGYKVIKFESGDEVFTALRNGTIAAAIFVGPAPLPNFKLLDSNYKLVSINSDIADRMKMTYHKSTITYTKISPIPIQTVAADSLLVTRAFKSAKKVSALLKIREAVYNNLDDLKETTGFHKAWQQVTIDNHGREGTWYNPTGKEKPKKQLVDND